MFLLIKQTEDLALKQYERLKLDVVRLLDDDVITASANMTFEDVWTEYENGGVF